MGKRPARKILSGVLSRQKPRKKRRKPHSRLSLLSVALGCAVLVAVAFAYFKIPSSQLARFSQRSLSSSKLESSHIDWKIVVRTTDDRPLSDEQMSEVDALVRKNMRSGKKSELQAAARQIAQKMALGVVAVTRSGKRGLVVSVSQRVPLLGVYADKPRFLTESGVVYGDYALAQDLGSAIGPVVNGIFANRSEPFTITTAGTLDTDEEELVLLMEAAELYKNIRDNNLKVKSVDFRRFRGFFVTLEKTETEVALGRSPFKSKLQRLDEILGRLEKTASTAARIELDYQGKAFIKEKKL